VNVKIPATVNILIVNVYVEADRYGYVVGVLCVIKIVTFIYVGTEISSEGIVS
jgi:hypothetical protein